MIVIGDNLGIIKIIDQKGINNQFKSFYRDLYTSEINDREQVNIFFVNLETPSLEATDR